MLCTLKVCTLAAANRMRARKLCAHRWQEARRMHHDCWHCQEPRAACTQARMYACCRDVLPAMSMAMCTPLLAVGRDCAGNTCRRVGTNTLTTAAHLCYGGIIQSHMLNLPCVFPFRARAGRAEASTRRRTCTVLRAACMHALFFGKEATPLCALARKCFLTHTFPIMCSNDLLTKHSMCQETCLSCYLQGALTCSVATTTAGTLPDDGHAMRFTPFQSMC